MQVEMKIELHITKVDSRRFADKHTDGYIDLNDVKRQIIEALEKVTDTINDWQKFVVIIKTED